MKFSQLSLALAFIAVLALVAGGIWLASSIFQTSSQEGGEVSRGFSAFFPFTQEIPSSAPRTQQGEPGAEPVTNVRKVTEAPVASATWVVDAGITKLRYIERETGHLYDAMVDAPTLTRRTNTTVPAVMDALWLSGTTTLMRVYEDPDTIRTVLGTLGTTTATDAVLATGEFGDYTSLATANGTIVGVRRTAQGAEIDLLSGARAAPRTLVRSPLVSLVPHIGGSSVYVVSAPSGSVPGSAYISTRTGLSRIIGPFVGLEIVPSDSGTRLLASVGGVNRIALGIVTSIDSFIELPLSTMAHKCAWVPRSQTLVICAVPKTLPAGLYPDAWALGAVETSDALWAIDTETGATTELLDPETEGIASIDAYRLVVDPALKALAFINRTDSSLWMLTLPNLQSVGQ